MDITPVASPSIVSIVILIGHFGLGCIDLFLFAHFDCLDIVATVRVDETEIKVHYLLSLTTHGILFFIISSFSS